MKVLGFFSAEFVRHILLQVALVMFVTVVVLFVVTLTHKALVQARERRFRSLQSQYIADVTDWLLRDVPDAPSWLVAGPRKKPFHFEVLAEVLINTLEGVAGQVEERVKQLAWQSGVVSYLMDAARSGRGYKKLVALEKLGLLKSEDTKGFFYEILHTSTDKEVILRIALALSFIASTREDVERISRVLSEVNIVSGKLIEYIYANTIRSFCSKGRGAELLNWFEAIKDDGTTPVLLKKSFIEACGAVHFSAASDVIVRYWNSFGEIAEMRIACIRALGRMSAHNSSDVILRGLRDEDWRVRAAAASYGNLCGPSAIPHLRACLHDRSYYVRLRAAEALRDLGEVGFSVLVEKSKSDDGFTREIVEYVINRRRYRD